MDPIEPWVDRDELRRLADALLAHPPSASPPANDAAYGDDFVGYAGGATDPPVSSQPPAPLPPQAQAPAPPERTGQELNARRALANARKIAQRGGLLGNHASPPENPPEPGVAAELTQVTPVPVGAAPAPGSTPFVARLQGYGAWLREGIQAKSFFLTDRDGRVLIDEVQSPKLQQVARTLAQASRTANRQAGAAAIGNLHVKIAPDTVLEVVPVMTRYGPLILGIIVKQPLSPRNVETVARGLQQVIDAGTEA